jgi:hypothetical protein
LFVESLVVSTLASILGLVIAGAALDHVLVLIGQASTRIPFWFDVDLSAAVIAYTAGLAIAGGAIVGVLPALRATGRRVQSGLQQLSSRSSQLTLGRVWTALIVVQVAIAVAALPAASFYTVEMTRFGTRDPGYSTEQFIRGWLSLERPEVRGDAAYERAFEARYADRSGELLRRLNAEPGVEATLVSAYPGTENATWIVVEDVAHRARVNYVGVGLFRMFDVPVLAGRPFVGADMREGSTAVLVNQTFVDSVAHGANVIGRRIRWQDPRGAANQAADAGEWFEIVGVVPDFPAELGPAAFSDNAATVYRPLVPGSVAQLVVRVRTGPAVDFTGPLRGITADVDPALMLHELMTQSESIRMTQQGLRATALGILLVTGSVLLLSAAGIYAMMSFTVARRRREIGIRSALGADPRRILSGVFMRAAAQLGIGAAVGLGLAVSLDIATGGWVMGGQAILLPIVVAIVMTVGLLAAFGPARRGLAVQPVEALREE